MTHLDISNTSYGQKKGWESNWQFNSQPLKFKNRPNFVVCRWRVTYHWKDLDKGYDFSLDLISIRGFHTKLWTFKVAKVPTMGILGLPFGSPRTKWHLGDDPMAKHRIFYKGKVVASLKSRPWWVLWICGYPWFIHAPKCPNYALTNLLFGFCKFVWVSELLANLPNPISEIPTHPSTPKVLRAKECTPTPSPSNVFTFGFIVESIKELGGASLGILIMWHSHPCVSISLSQHSFYHSGHSHPYTLTKFYTLTPFPKPTPCIPTPTTSTISPCGCDINATSSYAIWCHIIHMPHWCHVNAISCHA